MIKAVILKITIEWDVDLDDEELEYQDYDEEDLPKVLEFPLKKDFTQEEIDEEAMLEALTEQYGYWITGANFEIIYVTEEADQP